MTTVAASPTPPPSSMALGGSGSGFNSPDVGAAAPNPTVPASRRASISLFTRLKGPNRSSQQFDNYSVTHLANQGSDDGHNTPRNLTSPDGGSYAIRPSGKGLQGGTAANTSKKRSRRLWSRKTHDAPPVPDLPPSLNITLPFEPSNSTLTTSSSFSSTAGDKGDGYVLVSPRSTSKSTAATPTTATSLATTTPAAAVVHQYAAKEQKLKDSGVSRLQALTDARLTVAQVTEVIQLTGSEIKQRGLANVGILRPFRVGTTPATTQRLAELYLLTTDPAKYSSILSISNADDGNTTTSDIAIATFGKPSARRELNKQLAYANVHSVADLFKWALRRIKLSAAQDFGSSSQSPLSWYDNFRDAELRGGYDKLAFSKLLLPALPSTTQTFLTELLDLLTTVSAHYVANAMPASRAAKAFGYWIFGRIGNDKSSQDLETFLKEWKRSSSIMEHLLLAYLRDQSTKMHYMPTRLAELIEGYPHIPADSEFNAPTIRSASTSRPASHSALRIHLQGTNVEASHSRPRGPQDTLSSALGAKLPDAESSAEADDWTSLVTLARAAVKQVQIAANEEAARTANSALQDDAAPVSTVPSIQLDQSIIEATRQSALLRDEDARVFGIFETEFAERKKLLGIRDEVSLQSVEGTGRQPSFPSELPRSSSIYKDFMSRSGAGLGTLAPLRSKRLSTLAEDAASSNSPATPLSTSKRGSAISNNNTTAESSGLASLSSLGFDAGEGDIDLTLKTIDLPSSEPLAGRRPSVDGQTSTSTDGVKASPAMASKIRRQSSLGALRQRVRSSKRWEEAGDSAAVPALPTDTRPSFKVTKVSSTTDFDESVVALWQDSVLDLNASVSLPRVVFVQLNKEATSKLMSSASGVPSSPEARIVAFSGGEKAGTPSSASARGTVNGGAWLIIEEELIAKATAQSPLRRGAGSSGGTTRLRGASHDPLDGANGDDSASLEGRRSLFSPSLRSLGASIRRRASLKRMASFGTGLRKRANSKAGSPVNGFGNGGATGGTPSATPIVHAAVLPEPVASSPNTNTIRLPAKSPSRTFKRLSPAGDEEQEDVRSDMSSAASSRYQDAEGGEEQ